MVKRMQDVTKKEIEIFRSDIDDIRVSTRYSMPEKADKIREKIEDFFRDFSYMEIFKLLKDSKIEGNSRKTYGSIYEEALENLLNEKKKELSYNEIDELLDHLQNETNRTRKFVTQTKSTLLSKEEIEEKSKLLTEEDLNYKRLAVAASKGNLSNEQKEVFENEGKKVIVKQKEEELKVLSNYEEDLSREISKREPEEPKKL